MKDLVPSTRLPEPAQKTDRDLAEVARNLERADVASRINAIHQASGRWAARSRTLLLLLLALGLLGDFPGLFAADFRIQSVKVDQANRITIDFNAEADTTYTLLQGASVTNINTTVATYAAVGAGPAQFALNLSANPAAGFFRIQRASTAAPPLTTIVETSPADGETGVSVTRETIIRFSAPLAADTMLGTNNFYATFGARRFLSRIELSSDRRTASLFYLEPLPGSTRITVLFDAEGVKDSPGRLIDPAGSGNPGGIKVLQFETYSTTALAGTAVIGRVFASELMPGSDTGTNAVNRPLEGVIITVGGREQDLRAVTDAMGNFKLSPAPSGRFFVHIDGRTAKGSSWPNGNYYPVVGKAWEAVAGREDNQAGGTGQIYLPLILGGTLQPVSATADTTISFPPSVTANNPALSGVTITVPANSLFSDDGTRGGKVGIAPVPPDRLPGPLPLGLELPIVITVQTDGPLNFDKPAPVCFPNLPDSVTGQPLAPDTKQSLISFNHKKGIWEAVGPMTVSADGKFICTDPGVGILQPGWHGSGPPPVGPPPPPPGPRCGCGPSLALDNPNPGLACSNPGLDKCADRCSTDLKICLGFAVGGSTVCIVLSLGGCTALGIAGVAYCATTYTVCVHRCLEDNPCAGNAARLAAQLADVASLKNVPPAEDLIAQQILDRYRQIEALTYPYFIAGKAVPKDIQDQASIVESNANALASGNAEQYLRDARMQLDMAATESGEIDGNAPRYPVMYLAVIQRPTGPLLLRGETGPLGQYTLFLPRDGTLLNVSFYDPRTKSYGIVVPHVRPNSRYLLPRFQLLPVDSSFSDFDNDGLPDLVELVYGTDPANPDSDGDGIPDGAEVEQGTNPLDGRLRQTGIIAEAKTPGAGIDICTGNNLAILAEGAGGVSVFNVFNGLNPTLVAQVATPGFAQRVACRGNLIAVADGNAGLAVIDISVPATARVVQQVPMPSEAAQSVAVVGNFACVGLNSGYIATVDMLTGKVVDRLNVGGAVQDLAVGGDFLYALTHDRLVSVAFKGGLLSLAGSAGLPNVGLPLFGLAQRLFVGGDIAYDIDAKGYNTFSLTNPVSPTLIAVGSTTEFGWKGLVVNGSGLGVASVGPNSSDDAPHTVRIYDVSDPKKTDVFLTEFAMPGHARALSIFNGLAYVAADAAGLQVFNYLAYDAKGVPPKISLSASFPVNPAAANPGTDVRVTANATDDVQVSNVEFYVDGARAATDGNFPFEFRFATPAITPSKRTFTLRAKATDTGGNSTWSDELTVKLNQPAAPAIVKVAPANGTSNERFLVVTAEFNEAMNPATITQASFTLIEAGPDGQFGTADDVPVTNGVLQQQSEGSVASLGFAGGLDRGRYRAKVNRSLTDLDGIALASDQVWEFSVFGKTTIQGIVRSEDGKPLAGATVRLVEFGSTTTTGADGRFSLPDLVLPFEPTPTLLAAITINGQTFSGKLTSPPLVDRGSTDAGTLTIYPQCAGRFATGLSPDLGPNSEAHTFVTFNDGTGPALYAGGTFGVAKWTGNTWLPLGGAFADVAQGIPASVNALSVFDDGTGPALYAGGIFPSINGVILNSMLRWDGAKWLPVGGETAATRFVSRVNALVVFNDGSGAALYAGGQNGLAKWNGTQWTTEGGFLFSSSTGVYALTVFDDGTGPTLYVGGDFQQIGVYKRNGSQWSPLGTGLLGGVTSIISFNDGTGPALYAGGSFFLNADTVTVNHIAKWNGSQWSALGSGIDSFVLSLAVFDDGSGPALFAGGQFAHAGGQSVSSVAKWNGKVWLTIDGVSDSRAGVTGAGAGAGVPANVLAMTVFDDGKGARLYFGGDFTGTLTATEVVPAMFIASWDGKCGRR